MTSFHLISLKKQLGKKSEEKRSGFRPEKKLFGCQGQGGSSDPNLT
jgi:hypothetical protein